MLEGDGQKNMERKVGNLIVPKSPMLSIGNGRMNHLTMRKVTLSLGVHY